LTPAQVRNFQQRHGDLIERLGYGLAG